MKKHHEINFSPFASNVLDYVGNDKLCTPNGTRAKISQYNSDFIVTIGDVIYDRLCNLEASYILNQNQVGFIA